MGTKRKVLTVEGVDCPHCSKEIEDGIRILPGVVGASFNHASCSLVIDAHIDADMERVTGDAISVVRRMEPGARVMDKEKASAHTHERALEKAKKEKVIPIKKIVMYGAGAVLFAVGMMMTGPWLKLGFLIAAYIILGWEVLFKAARNIARGKVLDENFLMLIATVGAFVIGQYGEGVAVMLFYQVGELFQSVAVNRSRRSIKSLLNIRPDIANLITPDGIQTVSPDKVQPGQNILVKPGERVPLDGMIISGESELDTSALTGESLPRNVNKGMEVLSGSVNRTGALTIEVTSEYAQSTVARILALVENAGASKTKTERFISRFAGVYTPIVVGLAVLLAVIPPLLIPGQTFATWLPRALVFLVVSCPCALVISIPLGYFGGIGGASKRGILFKGSNFIDSLAKAETVVFDKTGTLTKGTFAVDGVFPEEGTSSEELLRFTARAESLSNHPIAQSIVKAWGGEVNQEEIKNHTEIAGKGVKAIIQGHEVLCGNMKLMAENGIAFKQDMTGNAAVHTAIDGKAAGIITLSDELKPDAASAIQELKRAGVKRTVMLTGDAEGIATKIAEQAGIDEVHAGLLPQDKVAILERLESEKSRKGTVVFTGDGINDAPVLARADVGIAMGGMGSDAAVEAADVVLMQDEPSKIAEAIRISRRTRNIVLQNIILALVIKAIVLLLGAGGLANLWEAVFADVGVALLAVLNAMRALRMKK